MLNSEPPIVVELPVASNLENIWTALTELEQMKCWFFSNIPDFKAEVGFETRFDVNTGQRNFPHVWKVVEVVPKEKLVVNWTYDGYKGSSNVCFKILHTDAGNIMRLTMEVLEDFSQNIPEFRRESAVGGWDYFINGQLKEYLARLPH